MRLASLIVPCLAAAALATACTKSNPDYCGSDPCPPDAPPAIDGMTGCTANPSICTGEVSTCLNDECVDCGTAANMESADCDVAAMPVCGADHTCRACAADSECTSGVCEGGSCIAAAEVAYVSTTGTATTGCDLGAPCSTMAQALAAIGTSRHYINVAPGTYSVSGATTINATVTIRAEGVTFERSNNDQILDVTGGDVTIIGATVHGATGSATNADGIRCSNGAGLTLHRVVVDDNAASGIDASDCLLTIQRGIISNNRKGGVRLDAGRVVITNSFIFNNGDNMTAVGGLLLAPTQAGSRVEFSTLRKNTAQTGNPGAMSCSGMQIVSRNNIVFGSVNTDVEVFGAACVHTYSVIGPMNTPSGAEVRTLPLADIGFVDPNGSNGAASYHITAASMVRGTAEAGSATGATAVDFDGDARPNPAGRADLGADEIP